MTLTARPTPTAALAFSFSLAAIGLALAFAPEAGAGGAAGKAAPRLAHMVFFTLKDHSAGSRERFAASCNKLLSGHEGTAYFSVGTIAEDVEEPVSVRDWDVALHAVFESKADRDRYLDHPRHKQFVEENRPHFAKVRVFDSYVPK
jgi:hypothetical protein